MDGFAIGIDLGTTNSCVACCRNGSVEILENADGGRITPSCVFYLKNSGTPPVVGQSAKRMADALPTNGIYEIKRFVGKTFDDVKDSLPYFSFNVKSDKFNNPLVIIERQGETFELTPQGVSALILKKIKKDVESKVGHRVDKTVITVPAYFNTTQREVTLAAAQEAGFTVLKLFNEPTSAALSYFFKNNSKMSSRLQRPRSRRGTRQQNRNDNCESECYALVYDLGGGTFDVSILKKSANNIDIICVDGNTSLGGKDLDNLIIDYVCDQLERNYKHNPKTDRRQMRRLQNKCEEAKIQLSTADWTTIILEGIVQDHPVVDIDFDRKAFELKAHSLFEKTINIVDRCLKNSQIPKSQIEHVILSGGSSRIPKIQEMLSSYFGGKSLNKFVNLDECVAEGAALQAAMLSDCPAQEIRKLQMIDVVPLSIGINDWVDIMEFVIEKDSTLPASNTASRITAHDQQQNMSIEIFEGEHWNAERNRYLGKVVLENLTPAPPGECEVSVTLTVDKNGILTVKAAEMLANNVKELRIIYSRGVTSDREVNNAITDAQEHEDEDKQFLVFAELKIILLQYCETVKYNLRILNLTKKHQIINDLCKDIQDSARQLELAQADILNGLVDKAKQLCGPLIASYNFESLPKL